MALTTTLTLNPSVDLLTTTPQVMDTHKMRCTHPIYHPGGGGINVARVVHRLGGDVQTVWLGGGALGHQLAAMLASEGLDHHQLISPQETRLSFSVHESHTARDYRFVLPGPCVEPMVLGQCLQDFYRYAADSLCWVVSGSLAPGMPEGVYADIARQAQAMGKHLVVDASGPALMAALRVGAFMVKPSLREMEEIAGQALPTHPLRLAQARQWLAQWPIQVIALSLSAEGAMLVTHDGAWLSPSLPVTVRSTIGAGDSFVGGFVSAMEKVAFNSDPSSLLMGFQHGMAASAAALSSLGTALCEAQDVTDLLGRVNISPLPD